MIQNLCQMKKKVIRGKSFIDLSTIEIQALELAQGGHGLYPRYTYLKSAGTKQNQPE